MAYDGERTKRRAVSLFSRASHPCEFERRGDSDYVAGTDMRVLGGGLFVFEIEAPDTEPFSLLDTGTRFGTDMPDEELVGLVLEMGGERIGFDDEVPEGGTAFYLSVDE